MSFSRSPEFRTTALVAVSSLFMKVNSILKLLPLSTAELIFVSKPAKVCSASTSFCSPLSLYSSKTMLTRSLTISPKLRLWLSLVFFSLMLSFSALARSVWHIPYLYFASINSFLSLSSRELFVLIR